MIVAQDLRPVASAFGEYRRILTSSFKLSISRKIQLMGTAYFLLGDGVENFVIFLPFLTLFGDIRAGFLFLFSRVLLRNRDPFQLPHWWCQRLADAEDTCSRRQGAEFAYSGPLYLQSDRRLYNLQHSIIRHQFWHHMNEIKSPTDWVLENVIGANPYTVTFERQRIHFISMKHGRIKDRGRLFIIRNICMPPFVWWFMIQGAPTYVWEATVDSYCTGS